MRSARSVASSRVWRFPAQPRLIQVRFEKVRRIGDALQRRGGRQSAGYLGQDCLSTSMLLLRNASGDLVSTDAIDSLPAARGPHPHVAARSVHSSAKNPPSAGVGAGPAGVRRLDREVDVTAVDTESTSSGSRGRPPSRTAVVHNVVDRRRPAALSRPSRRATLGDTSRRPNAPCASW